MDNDQLTFFGAPRDSSLGTPLTAKELGLAAPPVTSALPSKAAKSGTTHTSGRVRRRSSFYDRSHGERLRLTANYLKDFRLKSGGISGDGGVGKAGGEVVLLNESLVDAAVELVASSFAGTQKTRPEATLDWVVGLEPKYRDKSSPLFAPLDRPPSDARMAAFKGHAEWLLKRCMAEGVCLGYRDATGTVVAVALCYPPGLTLAQRNLQPTASGPTAVTRNPNQNGASPLAQTHPATYKSLHTAWWDAVSNMTISWHVEAVAVAPSHQRKAYGSRLTEAAMYLADIDNVPVFVMTVGQGLRDSLARAGFVCLRQHPLIAHRGDEEGDDDTIGGDHGDAADEMGRLSSEGSFVGGNAGANGRQDGGGGESGSGGGGEGGGAGDVGDQRYVRQEQESMIAMPMGNSGSHSAHFYHLLTTLSISTDLHLPRPDLDGGLCIMRRPVTLGTLSEKRGIRAVRVTLADSKDGGLEAEAHPKFTIMVSSVSTKERCRLDSEYRSVGCVRFAAFRELWAEVEQLCVDVGFEPPVMQSPLPRTYKRQSIGVKLTTHQLFERSRDLTGWLSEVLELPLPLRALEAVESFFQLHGPTLHGLMACGVRRGPDWAEPEPDHSPGGEGGGWVDDEGEPMVVSSISLASNGGWSGVQCHISNSIPQVHHSAIPPTPPHYPTLPSHKSAAGRD